MSMPEFPEGGTNITEEQAFNMLLTSIAMEELALSHIMNAEGEKLQYVLGTLPGTRGTCPTTEEVIQVNKSITKLLEIVAQNQLLLKSKLDNILEAKNIPRVPSQKDYLRLCSIKEDKKWRKGCCFSWESETRYGDSLIWKSQTPCKIYLPKDSLCIIDFHFYLCPRSNFPLCVKLEIPEECETTPARTFEGCKTTLEGSTVLHVTGCSMMPISFLLTSPEQVCVEKAILNIVKIN